jgi:hypothetical protein
MPSTPPARRPINPDYHITGQTTGQQDFFREYLEQEARGRNYAKNKNPRARNPIVDGEEPPRRQPGMKKKSGDPGKDAGASWWPIVSHENNTSMSANLAPVYWWKNTHQYDIQEGKVRKRVVVAGRPGEAAVVDPFSGGGGGGRVGDKRRSSTARSSARRSSGKGTHRSGGGAFLRQTLGASLVGGNNSGGGGGGGNGGGERGGGPESARLESARLGTGRSREQSLYSHRSHRSGTSSCSSMWSSRTGGSQMTGRGGSRRLSPSASVSEIQARKRQIEDRLALVEAEITVQKLETAALPVVARGTNVHRPFANMPRHSPYTEYRKPATICTKGPLGYMVEDCQCGRRIGPGVCKSCEM